MSKNIITNLSATHFSLNGQVYNKDTYTIRKITPIYPFNGLKYNNYAIAYHKESYNTITPYSFMSDFEINGVTYTTEVTFYQNLLGVITQGGIASNSKLDEVITAINNNTEKEIIVQISNYANNTITGIDIEIVNSVEIGTYTNGVFTASGLANYQHVGNTIVIDSNVVFTTEYVRITGQK